MASSPSSKLVSKSTPVAEQEKPQKVSAIPETPIQTPLAEPQLTASPSFPARARRFLWPILCFLQLGLLIGGYVRYQNTLTNPASHPPESASFSAPTKTLSPGLSAPTPVRTKKAPDAVVSEAPTLA